MKTEIASLFVRALFQSACQMPTGSSTSPEMQRAIQDSEARVIFLAQTMKQLEPCVKASLLALSGIKPEDHFDVSAFTGFLRSLADEIDRAMAKASW